MSSQLSPSEQENEFNLVNFLPFQHLVNRIFFCVCVCVCVCFGFILFYVTMWCKENVVMIIMK